MAVQGRTWEIPCENISGFNSTLTVFVHGDRIAFTVPRTQSFSLSVADANRLIEALRDAVVDACNTQ